MEHRLACGEEAAAEVERPEDGEDHDPARDGREDADEARVDAKRLDEREAAALRVEAAVQGRRAARAVAEGDRREAGVFGGLTDILPGEDGVVGAGARDLLADARRRAGREAAVDKGAALSVVLGARNSRREALEEGLAAKLEDLAAVLHDEGRIALVGDAADARDEEEDRQRRHHDLEREEDLGALEVRAREAEDGRRREDHAESDKAEHEHADGVGDRAVDFDLGGVHPEGELPDGAQVDERRRDEQEDDRQVVEQALHDLEDGDEPRRRDEGHEEAAAEREGRDALDGAHEGDPTLHLGNGVAARLRTHAELVGERDETVGEGAASSPMPSASEGRVRYARERMVMPRVRRKTTQK